jgi:hypothetical protein
VPYGGLKAVSQIRDTKLSIEFYCMPYKTRPLIKEVCRLVAEAGAETPGATRLVKLLYLADLEWRRRHGGEPLSNWNWLFWHFGPYAMEFKEVFGTQDVERVEFSTGKVAKFLNFKADELKQREVPDEVTRLLKTIVERWVGVDLNYLLDYVYFETEPMEAAKRGKPLDFSSVSPLPNLLSPAIDHKKFRELRAALRKRVGELSIQRQPVKLPLSLMQGEEVWKEDFEPLHLAENTPLKQSVDET